ncbi:MAG: hypothetical protein OEW60_02595, partial [Thiovulaceae bacterium]|nr:hypothetical protein [Sulfurimonadaceae bacterium]
FVKPNPAKEVQFILDDFKSKAGAVPPHFELLATLNPKRFEMFIQEITYLLTHPHIESDFFAFLRLYIAAKEQFQYCLMFNTKLLIRKQYSKETLNLVKEDLMNIPLNKKHKTLAIKVNKAIYDAKNFSKEDCDELKEEGWSDSDIYDAIDHGAFLFKYSKILKAYSTN